MRFLTLMPTAVIGATFIFTSCAIIKGGIETIVRAHARRTADTGSGPGTDDRTGGRDVPQLLPCSTRIDRTIGSLPAGSWHIRGLPPERRFPYWHAPPRRFADRPRSGGSWRRPELHGGHRWRMASRHDVIARAAHAAVGGPLRGEIVNIS